MHGAATAGASRRPRGGGLPRSAHPITPYAVVARRLAGQPCPSPPTTVPFPPPPRPAPSGPVLPPRRIPTRTGYTVQYTVLRTVAPSPRTPPPHGIVHPSRPTLPLAPSCDVESFAPCLPPWRATDVPNALTVHRTLAGATVRAVSSSWHVLCSGLPTKPPTSLRQI